MSDSGDDQPIQQSLTAGSGGDPVRALTSSVQRLTDWVEDNSAATHRLADRVRRHRLVLVVAIIGLVLDLCLSGLFIYQRYQQSCTNTQLRARQSINQRSFRAEYAKVAGQVAGLRQIRMAGTDQAKAYAGFDQFIKASETYLVEISGINRDLKSHPIGTC